MSQEDQAANTSQQAPPKDGDQPMQDAEETSQQAPQKGAEELQAATSQEDVSQQVAEPPGPQTQLPTASQERASKPARATPAKRKPKKTEDEGLPQLPEPPEKEYLAAVQPQLWQVHVDQLDWDLKCEYGQARPLDPQLAEHYFQSLKAGPEPRQMIRCLVWQRGQRML
jgi:hypothetical protein